MSNDEVSVLAGSADHGYEGIVNNTVSAGLGWTCIPLAVEV